MERIYLESVPIDYHLSSHRYFSFRVHLATPLPSFHKSLTYYGGILMTHRLGNARKYTRMVPRESRKPSQGFEEHQGLEQHFESHKIWRSAVFHDWACSLTALQGTCVEFYCPSRELPVRWPSPSHALSVVLLLCWGRSTLRAFSVPTPEPHMVLGQIYNPVQAFH